MTIPMMATQVHELLSLYLLELEQLYWLALQLDVSTAVMCCKSVTMNSRQYTLQMPNKPVQLQYMAQKLSMEVHTR